MAIRQPNTSRTFHRKSRLGCVQCKRLRVKCDEGKPACNYCVRNGRHCEYVVGDKKKGENSPESSPDSTDSALVLGHSCGSRALSALPKLDQNGFHLLDFFIREGITAYSLAGEDFTSMWRKNGLQVAFQSDTLLSAVLAFSSELYTARFGPDNGALAGGRWLVNAVQGHRKMLTDPNLQIEETLLTASMLSAAGYMDPNVPVLSYTGGVDMLGLGSGESILVDAHREKIGKSFLYMYLGNADVVAQSSIEPAKFAFVSYLFDILAQFKDQGQLLDWEYDLYTMCLYGIKVSIVNAFKLSTFLPILGLISSAPHQLVIAMKLARPFATIILLFVCASIRGSMFSNDKRRASKKWATCMDEALDHLTPETRHFGVNAVRFSQGTVFREDWKRLNELCIVTMGKIDADTKDFEAFLNGSERAVEVVVESPVPSLDSGSSEDSQMFEMTD